MLPSNIAGEVAANAIAVNAFIVQQKSHATVLLSKGKLVLLVCYFHIIQSIPANDLKGSHEFCHHNLHAHCMSDILMHGPCRFLYSLENTRLVIQ